MAITNQLLGTPIQGANLAKDSRNYAWRNPPQYTTFDDAFAYFIDDYIGSRKRLQSGMTLVMGGVPASAAISVAIINMVKEGMISPDVSLLLAGPAYKVFTRMLDNAGVEYLSGFESPEETAEFYKKLQEQDSLPSKAPLPKEVEAQAKEVVEEVELPKGGLMGAPSEKKAEDTVDIDVEATNLLEDSTEQQEDIVDETR